MKQIVRAIRYFTDKLKSYIVMGLFVILVPSFAMSQNLIPNQDNENNPVEKVEPKVALEEVVPKVAPPRRAGVPYGTIFQLQKPIACNDTPVIKNFLENMNGMIPLTMGTSLNPMGAILSLVQVYANPVSEKFAVVEHFAIQKSCIIFQGHDFNIILPERYGRSPMKPDQQAFN